VLSDSCSELAADPWEKKEKKTPEGKEPERGGGGVGIGGKRP